MNGKALVHGAVAKHLNDVAGRLVFEKGDPWCEALKDGVLPLAFSKKEGGNPSYHHLMRGGCPVICRSPRINRKGHRVSLSTSD